MDFSKEKIEKVLQDFDSSYSGIEEKETEKRLVKFGFNQIIKKESLNWWRKIFNQFTDLLVVLLIIAAVLSLIFGDFRDATIMFAIVLINAAIGFSQEFKTEQTLRHLNELVPKKCKVIRAGQEKEILSRLVVPGDILILQAGDDVPADARLFETYSLYADESSLTGESHPQHKHLHLDKHSHLTKDNMVYMGTSVLEGEAKAVAVKTGFATEFGKIAQETHDVKLDPSPLQKKLRQVGRTVAIIAAVILVIIVSWQLFIGENILTAFIFALALAAAVVPEGLPATVSVALSLGAGRLAKAKAVVRCLSSVESLGGVTVICTDKTGTLTEGKMALDSVWAGEEKITKWRDLSLIKSKPIMEVISLCQNVKENDQELIGDINEIALVKAVQAKKVSPFKIREEFHKIGEFSFSSARKMMTVILVNHQKNHSLIASKGAPNRIIEHCKLSPEAQKKILEQTDLMASKGLRVLAFAKRLINRKVTIKRSLENDLQFVCLVGLRDEIRTEVPQAIETCHEAGIRIIMLTGDYGLTAKSVAEEINLGANHNLQVISGEELNKFSDLELREKLLHPAVLYQILPGDKLKIVDTLQKMGEVVAVTGDGVNDAPALKKANIGVAMGKIGTDVAREASDMVLLDDNFATIVKAIKEGRLAWDNLKKFLFYVFASNAGELLTVVLGIVLLFPPAILAVQILAVDLGTDVLPSIALAADSAGADIMKKRPHSPKEVLLNTKLLYRLLYVGIIMGGGAVLAFWVSTKLGYSYAQATTASYATLVLCQIVNAFSTRYDNQSVFYKFFSNVYLLWAEVASFVLLMSIVYFKPIQNLLGTGPLEPIIWLVIILVMLFFLCVEEIKKYYLRKKA